MLEPAIHSSPTIRQEFGANPTMAMVSSARVIAGMDSKEGALKASEPSAQVNFPQVLLALASLKPGSTAAAVRSVRPSLAGLPMMRESEYMERMAHQRELESAAARI